MTTRGRQLRATLATALVLMPLLTPVAHAQTSMTHQVLASQVAAKTQAEPAKAVDVKGNTIEQTGNQLASGISEKKITYKNTAGDRTVMHAVSVDLKDKTAGLYAGTLDDSKDIGLQTVRGEAEAAIKNGHQVVAGLNADFFNMGTGEPSGNVVKDGTEIHAAKANSGEAFFGVKKNGEAMIGDQGQYDAVKGDLQQALGGLGILVKQGVVQTGLTQYGDNFAARSAVGIRQDGTVFFVTVDGKQSPYSNGMTTAELAETMKDQGAVEALNLDGGGSATYLSRTPGDKDLSLKNKPSDGEERKVANSWLITTTEKSDHTFDRAQVSPKDQVYTPESTINFTAKGVDKAGYDAELPVDTTWSLQDKGLGEIDAKTGAFKSNGKTGDVTANLIHDGKTVGQATVTVATPDAIEFLNKKLSLKTDFVSSLGMTARYKGRDVTLKTGDIAWALPAELGTIDDQNQLHTAGKHAKGTITATVAGTKISESLEVQIGQLPVVLYDFEKGLDDWKVSGSGRGEENSLSLASPEDGQVRFGDHAMEVKFDFTTGQKGTTLGAYAGPEDKKEIPGVPTAIGMWVYATPEAQGYWLRSQIYDGKGSHQGLNFTDQVNGINWTGWKYVEAEIPASYQGPYSTFPKQVVRMMALKSGKPGGSPQTKGSIYVDNIRAVYGANVDDLKSPIVDNISVDGKTFKDGNITITTKVHDDKNDPNMSGIDWEKNKIYVDGQDLTGDSTKYTFDPDGTFTLKGYQYANGTHHIKVSVYDKFGNRTDKDAYFEVHTSNQTGINLEVAKNASAKLGSTVGFDIMAENLAKVKSGEFVINIGKGFPVKDVKFAVDSKDNTVEYDKNTGILKLHVKDNTTGKGTNKSLAHVTLDVPTDTEADAKLVLQLTNGTAEFVDASSNADMLSTFASKPTHINIEASYQVKLGQMIVGAAGMLTVTDTHNKPVGGAVVTMKMADGKTVEVGKTNSQGQLKSDKLTKTPGKFTLTATIGSHSSFPTPAQAFAPEKSDTPSNLLTGATQDPTTQKTITWFSNPIVGKQAAIMQIAPTKDYTAKKEKAFKDYKGEQKTFTYVSDSKAIRVNSVTAKGLQPGTEYTFRVGNGEKWSAPRQFKTLTDSKKLSFNIFGDTQVSNATQLADFDKIIERLETSKNKPDFALHVGDFNDDQAVFNEADITSQMFDKHPVYDSLDMIHVLGNHEYMGDDGSKATAMLGTPSHNGAPVNKKGTFSVDYGNMHIASLGWTNNVDEMKQELDWLRQDMQASNKTWKIVATHQPPYNKNPSDSESTMFRKMLPPVCDELGIDVVFSGHDHSYGRTKKLFDNKENPTKGTTYLAAGHTGDKTYDILPNEPDAWKFLQNEKDKNQKVYLTAEVNDKEMKIVTRDPDGKEVDAVDLVANKHPQTITGGNNGQGGGQTNGGTDVGKPTPPTKPTEPGKPTPPTKPTEPGKPTPPTKPTEPGKPTPPTKPTEPGKPTPPTKPTEPGKPTPPTKPGKPTSSTSSTKPTVPVKPVTPVDSSKPTTTASAHKKSVPAVVTAVKGMALYRKPDFSKAGRLIAYRQQAQMHQPQFKVLGMAKSKAGHLRYHVRDMNKKSKSYGKTGYITASSKYVQSAEYTKAVKLVTVINAKGLNAYSNGKLAGKTKHHYHQGQVLNVKRIVRQNGKYRFQLANKQYISANKQDVRTGKHTQPKTVTVKQSINLYRDVNFKHKLHQVSAKTVLKVTGWDYSSKGVFHYRVAGGYVTASHTLVK
ncbi:phosphodiester glycosidase family protein [Levilactobacillus fujinensis]|uniref:Phosphodiester glycosidase family protein n=1 Tax=Levilactobacillus fujinensis TaxID=2486024 RepID=A0ABW1TK21_9LACO